MRSPAVDHATLSAAQLDAVLAPRDGVVAERRIMSPSEPGTVRFEQAEGPLAFYQRTVTVGSSDGAWLVTQEVRLRVGLPGFSWLFALALRSHLAKIGPLRRCPWWAPPCRLSRRASVVLATLCLLTVVIGYLADLLADTMTYAAADFHVGKNEQGTALAVVEAGAIGALVLLQIADRRGRRPVLVGALGAASLLSALGASSPSLIVLTASQLLDASLVGAGFVIVGVMAVEEMPAGSRAWALGVIGMCFGLGSGLALAVLPLADLGRNGWRWPYAIGLLGVPAVIICARWLPESVRWPRPVPYHAGRVRVPAKVAAAPARGSRGWRRLSPTVRRRLAIIGAGGFLLALFASPASQFQNEYLHVERHLSATRISLLEQLSGTIGGIGALIGGRLADTWGRRPVAALGVGLGTIVTLVMYTTGGTGLWVWNTLGSLIAYGTVPALAVYGAELFPTSIRARAGGALTVMAAAGGVVGLIAVGNLSAAFGTLAPALGVLAVGPLIVVLLIVAAYPETVGLTLEELNPVVAAVGLPAGSLSSAPVPDRQGRQDRFAARQVEHP